MSGHPRVIGYLQRAVSHEFSAAQQYTLQAVLAESWNLPLLSAELRAGAHEELAHAEAFIGHLVRLGITPSSSQPRVPPVGRSHAELLRYGLATEVAAVRLYEEAAQFCARTGDTVHHAVFARILGDERQHQRDLERNLQALGAGLQHE